MWKQRCDIIPQKNELTYEGRQRDDMYLLCKFLQTQPTELLEKDLHYIDRDDNFFKITH